MNHLVLISGLGSSLSFFGARYRAWARKLEKRLGPLPWTTVYEVSSDGSGEKDALQAIVKDKARGRVIIIGHSNGARDGLFMATMFHYMNIKVDYFASLDMTLGEFGAEAHGNIQYLDEFHARLQTVDFHPSFKPSAANYHKWEINSGHVAMASHPTVQDRIYKKVKEVLGQ